MPATGTGISRVGRVTVPVSDQDRSIAFYTEVLGMEVRADVTMEGEGSYRWVEVAPPGAVTSIAIVPPMEGETPGIQTRVGLSSPDVDADYARLKAAGVDVDEVQRMGDPVPPMFFFRDPDGNNYFVAEDP
jgi:catechol 2,3-dioxygenase-like lactoylglutathione lyase family enzyme